MRLLEELYPVDTSASQAEVVDEMDESAWELDEMRRRKEEQEAEAEDSEEGPLVRVQNVLSALVRVWRGSWGGGGELER